MVFGLKPQASAKSLKTLTRTQYINGSKFKLPKNFGNIVLIIKFVHLAFNTYMLQLIVTKKYVDFFSIYNQCIIMSILSKVKSFLLLSDTSALCIACYMKFKPGVPFPRERASTGEHG